MLRGPLIERQEYDDGRAVSRIGLIACTGTLALTATMIVAWLTVAPRAGKSNNHVRECSQTPGDNKPAQDCCAPVETTGLSGVDLANAIYIRANALQEQGMFR